MSHFKVTVKKWHTFASWKWEVSDEFCSICRSPFDAHCPDCKYPGDDCPPIWGTCTHAFHMHCILKWLGSPESQQQCPMCRSEWTFRE